jgi:hypothetical protein
MSTPQSIIIDGVKYLPESAGASKDGLPAVIVRAYSGVFFGYLKSKTETTAELVGARQIFYWDSAGLKEKTMTCPDIATNGVGYGSKISKPADAVISQVGAIFMVSTNAEQTILVQGWASK